MGHAAGMGAKEGENVGEMRRLGAPGRRLDRACAREERGCLARRLRCSGAATNGSRCGHPREEEGGGEGDGAGPRVGDAARLTGGARVAATAREAGGAAAVGFPSDGGE